MQRKGVRTPALIQGDHRKADDSLTADRIKDVRPPGKGKTLPGDSFKRQKNRDNERQVLAPVVPTLTDTCPDGVPIETKYIINGEPKNVKEKANQKLKKERHPGERKINPKAKREVTPEVFAPLQSDDPNPNETTRAKEGDRTHSMSSQEREHRRNKMKIIYPNAGHNEVLVTLGETQRRCEVKGGVEVTLVSKRAWHSYVRLRRNDGRPHLAYEAHMKLSREERMTLTTVKQYGNASVSASGPFAATFWIDGFEVRTEVYVTGDHKFKEQFMMGEEMWLPKNVKTMHQTEYVKEKSKLEEHTHEVNNRCATRILVNNKKVDALIDTGAGPSVMGIKTYIELGGTPETLSKITYDLIAANDTPMKTYGVTEFMQFEIGGQTYDISFTVVDNLGDDDVILGRDFLQRYDVLVDLPKNRITIRNTSQAYSVRAITNIGKMKTTFTAKAEEAFTLKGEEVKLIQFNVDRKKSKGTEDKDQGALWQGYVETTREGRLAQKGAGIGSALITIRDGKIHLPVLNANQDREKEVKIKPKDTTVQILPVYVTYQRQDEGGTEVKYSWIKEHVRHVEISDNSSSDENSSGTTTRAPMSLAESQTTFSTRTNFPLESRPEDVIKEKVFLTRPETKHLEGTLNDRQMSELQRLLDDYQELFSQTKTDIGRTDVMQHDIVLEAGSRPFREAMRRMAPDKRRMADEQIQLLIEMSVIRPSNSPFASAVVLANKNDGSKRFCMDFRKLNDLTIKDAFPLPRIDESLESLGTAKYFTSLDMGSAFWQVELTEESIAKTAFITCNGLWEWTRMPFGLCNATATFQRLMSKVLKSVSNRYGNLVLCYVDDILIATRTVEEHIQRLREVFQCLRRAGLKLKASKCKLLDTEIKFLGRRITEEGIEPDPENISKVLIWKSPRNVNELSSFLGFANYYREFVKGFAGIVAPLNRLKAKNTEYKWDEAAQGAFEQVKTALTSKPVLALPDEYGEFVLDTDASLVAISGILHQYQVINGQRKLVVISYGSRGLRAAERNYGAPKCEMLAALTFCEQFRTFLTPRKFTLRCDNQALAWLKTYSTSSTMVARWITRLSSFNFVILHRDRRLHTNADGLSKQTQHYERAEQVKDEMMPGFSFISQEQFDALPVLRPQEDDIHHPPRPDTKSDELKRDLGIMKEPEEELRSVWLDETEYSESRTSTRSDPPMAQGGPKIATTNMKNDEQQQTIEEENLDVKIEQPTQGASENNEGRTRLDAVSEYIQEDFDDFPDVNDDSCGTSCEDCTVIQENTNKTKKRIIKGPDGGVYIDRNGSTRSQCRQVAQACAILVQPKYGTLQLKKAQRQDVALSTIIKYLFLERSGGVRPGRTQPALRALTQAQKGWFTKNKAELELSEKKVLLKRIEDPDGTVMRRTIILPQLYQWEVMHESHDMMGHQGENKTYAKIAEHFDFPGMREEISRYVASCQRCQQSRGHNPIRNYPLKPIVTTRTNEMVEIDFEKLSVAKDGSIGLLVVVDHFSKYAMAYPMKEFSGKSAAIALFDNWVLTFGSPEIIQSDQGSQFESELFQEFTRLIGSLKTRSTPYHPQTNGLVERQNRTLVGMLRVACSRYQDDWPEHVKKMCFAYNCSRHESTKLTPNMLMLSREMATPIWWFFPNFQPEMNMTHSEFARKHLLDIPKMNELARHNMQAAQKRQKRNHDKKIKQEYQYKVGEKVLVYLNVVRKGGVRKLERQWRGPFEITKIHQEGRFYEFENGYKAHYNRLKVNHIRPHEMRPPNYENFIELWDDMDDWTVIAPTEGAPSFSEEWDCSHASEDESLKEPDTNKEHFLRDRNTLRGTQREDCVTGEEFSEGMSSVNENYIGPEGGSIPDSYRSRLPSQGRAQRNRAARNRAGGIPSQHEQNEQSERTQNTAGGILPSPREEHQDLTMKDTTEEKSSPVVSEAENEFRAENDIEEAVTILTSESDDEGRDLVTQRLEGSVIIERRTAEYPTFSNDRTYTKPRDQEHSEEEPQSMSIGSNSDEEGTLKGSFTEIIEKDEGEDQEELPRIVDDGNDAEREDIYPSSEDDLLQPWTGGPVTPYWGQEGQTSDEDVTQAQPPRTETQTGTQERYDLRDKRDAEAKRNEDKEWEQGAVDNRSVRDSLQDDTVRDTVQSEAESENTESEASSRTEESADSLEPPLEGSVNTEDYEDKLSTENDTTDEAQELEEDDPRITEENETPQEEAEVARQPNKEKQPEESGTTEGNSSWVTICSKDTQTAQLILDNESPEGEEKSISDEYGTDSTIEVDMRDYAPEHNKTGRKSITGSLMRTAKKDASKKQNRKQKVRKPDATRKTEGSGTTEGTPSWVTISTGEFDTKGGNPEPQGKAAEKEDKPETQKQSTTPKREDRPLDACLPEYVCIDELELGAVEEVDEVDMNQDERFNTDWWTTTKGDTATYKRKQDQMEVETMTDDNPKWSPTIKYKEGYLLDTKDSVAISMSADCAMQVGLPADMKKHFGHEDYIFSQRCGVGKTAVLPPGKTRTKKVNQHAYYLMTKLRYFTKPSLNDVESCMMDMARHAQLNGVRDISMPRIGCGMDKLSWKKVYAIIDTVFRRTDITITIYLLPKLRSVEFPNRWDETDKSTKFYKVFDTYSSYGDLPAYDGWFSWRKSGTMPPKVGKVH